MMYCLVSVYFFFKQKTAYEMRISDWSSDVCSSDLSRSTPSVTRAVTPHLSPPRNGCSRRQRRTNGAILPLCIGAPNPALPQRGDKMDHILIRSEERRVGKRVCQYV